MELPNNTEKATFYDDFTGTRISSRSAKLIGRLHGPYRAPRWSIPHVRSFLQCFSGPLRPLLSHQRASCPSIHNSPLLSSPGPTGSQFRLQNISTISALHAPKPSQSESLWFNLQNICRAHVPLMLLVFNPVHAARCQRELNVLFFATCVSVPHSIAAPATFFHTFPFIVAGAFIRHLT